jgi:hypothetical protein
MGLASWLTRTAAYHIRVNRWSIGRNLADRRTFLPSIVSRRTVRWAVHRAGPGKGVMWLSRGGGAGKPVPAPTGTVSRVV